MGHLVGAGAISVEDARQGLEAAGADMVAHDARRPWEPGYIRYKVIRGTLDTSGVTQRRQARSRYGAKKED